MKYDNQYQIINKHRDKEWYYTVRIKRQNLKKAHISKLAKHLAIKFEMESPIDITMLL